MPYFNKNIEDAAGYVPGYQPRANDVVKLNTNENPYPPSPRVLEALRSLTGESLRRYPDPLGQSFRRVAADLHGVEPEWILCCNGGDDLLSIAIRAICGPQRPLAYPVPTYSLYPVLARLHDCPVQELPFHADYSLPDKLVETQAPLTIVCNPNAPSGTRIAPDKLGKLAAALEGVLLIDEAYADYAEGHCLALVKNHPNVIILRSMSKGYSLAGVRFGYGLAQPELMEGLLKVKDSYNVNALSLVAATAALQDQDYVQDHIRTIKASRRILTEQLRELGWTVGDSEANFILAHVTRGDARTLHRQLAERHLYVRYFDLPGLEDKLRISVGTPEENQKLIRALQDLLA